jgi:hypothetical protein
MPGYNRLTGTIPTELGGLTSLTRLDLRKIENAFCLLHFAELISQFAVSQMTGYETLTGTIPTELGLLLHLSYLDLSDNYLHGTVPTFLTALVNLGALRVEFALFLNLFLVLLTETNLLLRHYAQNTFISMASLT